MGATKNLFMEDREAELYDNRGMEEIHTFRAYNQISDSFVSKVEEYDNGDVTALEVAVDFRNEIERLKTQIATRSTWIDENKDSIENEAAKYQHEYGGYKILRVSKPTYDYEDVPGWKELNDKIKEIEKEAVDAFKLESKGKIMLEDGCVQVVPAKISKLSTSLRFTAVKK